MDKSVTRIIEEVVNDICNNYCKYRDTSDDNCECEVIRNGGECPLNKL